MKHHKFTRQTKIVATLGPASSDEETLRKLIRAGVNVFRFNFSHGTHADHKARYDLIEKLSEEFDTPFGTIGDLQGPKLRVGKFENDRITLQEGQRLRLDLDETPGDETRVNLPHPEIISVAEPGTMLLMDDGKVRVQVIEKGDDYLMTEVIAGQKLSNNKGVNVPGVILPIAALTEKDREDMEAALDIGVDWIALSFVQKAEDVQEAKELIKGRAALMAKIEKPSALEHFDAILQNVDGIMLARGDLGVEIPAEEVPAVQKRIVRKVRYAGKPIIVATQMLESMIEAPAPTRAEASDVATAVYDGTDAVMLSGETAAGKYPVEAVSIMDRICRHTEKDYIYRTVIEADQVPLRGDPSDAITHAAYEVARSVGARCIVNYTSSGSTTLRTARERPSVPILSLSHNKATARRLTLSYGVYGVYTEDVDNFEDTVNKAVEIAKKATLVKETDKLVLTAGVPFATPGSTNILRVIEVD